MPVMFSRWHVSVGVGLTANEGGLTTSVNHFTSALGGSVVVFSGNHSSETTQLIANEICHVKTVNNFFGRAFAYATESNLKKAEEYVSANAEIITCHCLYRFHCHFAYKMFKKYGIPYNVVLHGALDEFVRSHSNIRKCLWLSMFGKRFLAEAKHVICATVTEKINASKFYPKANYADLYWPTEFYDKQWAKLRENRHEIRAKYGISEECKIVLYLGRLNSVKNPLDVIKSLGGFPGRVVLFLVGPEDDISFGQCHNVAQKYGVEIRCTGLADFEIKEEIFAITDCYVSLSHHENFNYSLVESLARGIPVIISRGNDLHSDIASEPFCHVADDLGNVRPVLQEIVSVSGYEAEKEAMAAGKWVKTNMQFRDFRDKLATLYQ
jgi:glycosyltransferase involved in cell wall biosynthesis